ncbi:unnamed protein product [Effrenium voratum]|uniref:Uncharacterized protein n=1 Tax=Effrenium voratum TaxID=2562239 RepID=A0AA36MRN5_9DINO|nr:unnamed protein product [Effrenium voratum]
MTKSERLGQGQSLAARTKKAEEAFLARFRNPGRSKPPQRLPRSQSAQRRTEAGTHRSQEHANLRARAEDSQDVQEQLDSVAAASGLPISDKVTHDTEIQSPIDGLKQECADRPALAELQNKTCDLSKASIKDLRKASVGHGEEELAEEFPKVAEEEDTITVLPPLPGDGHGAPTPGLDAVLQSALEQVVEEAKACFDEAPHSTDDAFPTGFLEEVLRRGTDRMLDSPTCERTRTWREIKGQQDEAVHGDNARDRRCAPELTRSQEDTCFVAKLLQEAEVALREGSNDSLLWDTAQSCTAVSCLPRTLCDSPKVCQERQTQPSNEDGSAVPVEEALPLDDDMDQPKEEAVKTSPWTEQNHSPNISLEEALPLDDDMDQPKEEGQEQPYEDGSAVPVEEALPLDDDMDQPKEEAVKTSPWTEQNHSLNISLEEGQEQPYEDGSAAPVEEALPLDDDMDQPKEEAVKTSPWTEQNHSPNISLEEALPLDDDMDQPKEEAVKTSPWTEQNHSPNISLEEGQEQPYEDGSAVPVEEALPLDDDMDQPKEEAVKTSPWTEQNHSPNISLEEGQEQPYEDGSAALVEEALLRDDDMDQPREEAAKTSPWSEQNHSPNISLQEGQEQPYEDGSAALVEEALPLDDDMDQPKEEAVKTSPWTEQNHSPNISLEEALPLDDDMDQPKEEAVKTSPWTEQNHSPNISLEEGQEQPYEDGSAALVEEALPLDDDMDQPKEEAVKTSPWTEQNHSPNISLEASLRGDLLMGQVKESAGSSSLSTLPDSMKVSLEEHRSQPFGSADFPPEEASLRGDLLMGQVKESAGSSSLSTMPDSMQVSLEEHRSQPFGSADFPPEEASLRGDLLMGQVKEHRSQPFGRADFPPEEASLRGDLLMGQVKESAGSSSLSTMPDSMQVSLEEHRSQPFGRADFPPEEASLRDELLMGEPKESAVISSLSIMPDSLKISVSQLQEQQEQPSDEDGGALPLEEASSQDDSFIRQPEEETLDLASLHRLCEQRLSAATRPSVLDVISEDELTDTSALAAATLAGRLAARSGFASSLQEEYTFSSAGGSDAAGTHAPDGLDSLELGGRRDVDPMRSDGAQDKPVALQAEKERLQDAMESADEPGEDGQSHSSPENAKTVSQRKQPRQPRQQQKLSSSFDQLIENADAKIFVPNTLKASAPEPTLPTFVQGEGEGAEGAEGGSQRIHHQSLEHGSGEASSSGPKNPKLKVDKATWLQAGASSAASTALSLARRYGLSLAVLAAGCAYMTAVEMAWQLGPEPEWFA